MGFFKDIIGSYDVAYENDEPSKPKDVERKNEDAPICTLPLLSKPKNDKAFNEYKRLHALIDDINTFAIQMEMHFGTEPQFNKTLLKQELYNKFGIDTKVMTKKFSDIFSDGEDVG